MQHMIISLFFNIPFILSLLSISSPDRNNTNYKYTCVHCLLSRSDQNPWRNFFHHYTDYIEHCNNRCPFQFPDTFLQHCRGEIVTPILVYQILLVMWMEIIIWVKIIQIMCKVNNMNMNIILQCSKNKRRFIWFLYYFVTLCLHEML